MTTQHECRQHEKFEENARLMGKIEESIDNFKRSITNTRGDINMLFDQNRTILDKLNQIEQQLAFNKGKFFMLGGIIAVAIQVGLIFIKESVG